MLRIYCLGNGNHPVLACHPGQTDLGRGGATHPVSVESLRAALFTTDEDELRPVDTFSDESIGWDSPAALTDEPPQRSGAGWRWHQPDRVVEGPTWGGNLEVLHWNLAVGRWLRPAEDYAGCILRIETSEEMPSATEVFRMLRNMGEPVYTLDSNPTAERIAQLIFDVARDQGLPVARVTVWETPTSSATYAL